MKQPPLKDRFIMRVYNKYPTDFKLNENGVLSITINISIFVFSFISDHQLELLFIHFHIHHNTAPSFPSLSLFLLQWLACSLWISAQGVESICAWKLVWEVQAKYWKSKKTKSPTCINITMEGQHCPFFPLRHISKLNATFISWPHSASFTVNQQSIQPLRAMSRGRANETENHRPKIT